jgi:hypothetical protein
LVKASPEKPVDQGKDKEKGGGLLKEAPKPVQSFNGKTEGGERKLYASSVFSKSEAVAHTAPKFRKRNGDGTPQHGQPPPAPGFIQKKAKEGQHRFAA